MVIGLCERFSKLPSELENEDATILRMLEIVHQGSDKRERGEQGGQ